MNLKRAGALGLSCAMLSASLLGTTTVWAEKKEEISGKVRYAFWDTAQQPYFEKCIEKFNEQYPDVEIVLEPSSFDEYWTKLEAGATGGSIADVFWMNGPNIIKYAEGDILMDINDRIEEAGMESSMRCQRITIRLAFGIIRKFLMKPEFLIQQMIGPGKIWRILQNS